MTTDPVEPAAASLFDGQTALRHRVHVVPDGATLRIVERDETVPLAELRAIGDRSRAVYGRAGHEGWRLALDPPWPGWIGALPRQEHHGGILDRIGVAKALVAGVAITAAVVVALATGSEYAARLIPVRWEAALGRAIAGDAGGRLCAGAGGQAAIDALAARLATEREPALHVRVVDIPIANAVAMPGREVLLFQGLIRDAASPDEVAGVLAHEIGHVERRHVLTAIIRQLAVGMVTAGADGGTIAGFLLANRHSRGAEREADGYAVDALVRARISPAGTAGFFRRMAKQEGSLGASRAIGYLSSHPLSADREARYAAAATRRRDWRPAMSAGEWRAVRAMCGGASDKPRDKRQTT